MITSMFPKGLIFDKDGTLFDFNATWGPWARQMMESETGGDAALLARLADALGYDLPTQTFRPGSVVIAETVDVAADHMLAVLPPQDKSALIARMNKASAEVPQAEAAPLRPLLSELRGMGLQLGVATNDAETPARQHIERAGITEFFDLILGFDSGFGGKPAPGQLLAFLDHTGLDVADCMMVGDSLHDLQTGRGIGMRTIGVLTGPAPRSELAPFADVVLENIGEIPNWLRERF